MEILEEILLDSLSFDFALTFFYCAELMHPIGKKTLTFKSNSYIILKSEMVKYTNISFMQQINQSQLSKKYDH